MKPHPLTAVLLLACTAPLLAQSPAPQSSGAQTFSRTCAGCHGADGRGGERAPDIATNRTLSSRTAADLESIVKAGVPGKGMPAFAYLGDQAVTDVVAHLRTLQGKDIAVTITGDPALGKRLFEATAGCARCHMVKGTGGFLGPDLSAYASGIAPSDIHLAIADPDRHLQPTYAVAHLVTAAGASLSGTIRAEDNFSLTLQTSDGAFHTFRKSTLKSLRPTNHSVMPQDYGIRLTPKELDDITAYLLTVAADAPPKPARRKR